MIISGDRNSRRLGIKIKSSTKQKNLTCVTFIVSRVWPVKMGERDSGEV